jgi:hypothetical protein
MTALSLGASMPSSYTLTQIEEDLAIARAQAARHLDILRSAEQAVKDARDDFEKARRVVARHTARHRRLVTGKN